MKLLINYKGATMIKKGIALAFFISLSSGGLSATKGGKNRISDTLIYTPQALEVMNKQKITCDEIELVLRTGTRKWDLEKRGIDQFLEKKNGKEPLAVYINRKNNPNIVVNVVRLTSALQKLS